MTKKIIGKKPKAKGGLHPKVKQVGKVVAGVVGTVLAQHAIKKGLEMLAHKAPSLATSIIKSQFGGGKKKH